MLEQPLNLIFLTIVIGLVPMLFALSTAYLKVNIVFQLLKNAIGAQQVPSAIIIAMLSLSLTILIMQPVFSGIAEKIIEQSKTQDLSELSVEQGVALLRQASGPWQEFIIKHAGAREIATIKALKTKSQQPEQATEELAGEATEFPVYLISFVLTEIKEAFTIGLVVMIPFLIIDFIVANILAGIGMFMFSPVLIALPLKILIIVAFDFWSYLFRALYLSYA